MTGNDAVVVAVLMLAAAFTAALIGWLNQRKIAETLGQANTELAEKVRVAAGTEHFLQARQVMIGASACPMCGVEVAHAREVDLIERRPDRPLGTNVVLSGSAEAVRLIVLFEPCGCLWDPFELDAQTGAGQDLRCTLAYDLDIHEPGPGRFRFDLRRSESVPSRIEYRTADE